MYIIYTFYIYSYIKNLPGIFNLNDMNFILDVPELISRAHYI